MLSSVVLKGEVAVHGTGKSAMECPQEHLPPDMQMIGEVAGDRSSAHEDFFLNPFPWEVSIT